MEPAVPVPLSGFTVRGRGRKPQVTPGGTCHALQRIFAASFSGRIAPFPKRPSRRLDSIVETGFFPVGWGVSDTGENTPNRPEKIPFLGGRAF